MSTQTNTQAAAQSTAEHVVSNGNGKPRNVNGKKRSTRKPRTESTAEADNPQLDAAEIVEALDLVNTGQEESQIVAKDLLSQPQNVEQEVEDHAGDNSPTDALEELPGVTDLVDASPAWMGKPEKDAIELTTGKLIELLQNKSAVQFFHDQHGNPFVWVPSVDDAPHFECHPLGSKAFRAKLVQLADAYSTRPTPAGVINEVIKAGELLAFKVKRRDLANRHRSVGGQIFIDMGDPDWLMIRVTPEGWEQCNQAEAMFFRPQHVKPLPEPISGGDPFELFDFVAVESDEDKLLVLSWAVSALCPDVPSPILNLTGIQGSAKTTKSKRLRDLIDPSVTPVLGDTRGPRSQQ